MIAVISLLIYFSIWFAHPISSLKAGVLPLANQVCPEQKSEPSCSSNSTSNAAYPLSTASSTVESTATDENVRYACFGTTMAWVIYAEDNFIVNPDLADYQKEAEAYKLCVWDRGVKEYMPFPARSDVFSQ